MNHTARFATACTALYGLLFCLSVQATDVSTKPLKADVLVKPNVIFAMDDSGSMDWEVLLNTSSGVVQWNTSSRTAWDAAGNPLVPDGYSMQYLFPNGTGTGAMHYTDSSTNGKGVPPSPQFATLRSSSFNPLYYNPAVTYHPWPSAYHDGAVQNYGNAAPTAAKSHPALASSVTMNLTVNQTYSFNYQIGMMLPNGSLATSSTDGWTSTTYYPATYWVVDASCTPATGWSVTCVTAPNGQQLRRIEIRSGNTFPSGRSYTAEMQNFANWWSYYRKRKLMLAGSMGSVLEGLTGMRVGLAHFNNRITGGVSMYDTDATSAASNARRIAGYFYTNPATGATPTADTLNYIGNQFLTNNGIIQSSCQRNNAFVVTDGFANGTEPTPPAYSAAATNSQAFPYQTTQARSLSDVALSYFTNNLRNGRTTLTDGRVTPGDPTVTNADMNTNLHMNTYGMTLGVRGSIWPMPAGQTPWTNPFTWPAPVADTQTSIDDLWHSTINGRGQMYIATDVTETTARVQDGLNDMLSNVGAQSSVAVSSVNLRRGDGKAYLGIYNPKGWTGDITANAVNPSTGEISTTALWSAATRLTAKDWTTRVIATSVNGVGTPFTAANVGAIVNPGDTYGVTADVIDYLRGDRTGENTVPATFRRRLSVMAAVLNARPAVSASDRVVYAPSSEGMVHALDSDTGEELWAFVPGSALSEMGGQTRRTWSFETYLDGSPQLYTVGSRKILIGGRGSAGGGYYALDVTNPRGLTEATLASRLLWEFPTTQAVTTSGLSIGLPVVVKTANHGTVALITQGYNGVADGRGRLYVLNALTGALIHTFQANSGDAGIDPGLAQVTGLVENDGNVRYVYGGDERGNLWRFDLQTLGTPMHMALLRDSAGNRQPITTAPTLVGYQGHDLVLVGTGRLLGVSDFGSTAVQSFYAIKDTGTELTNLRSGTGSLIPRTLSAENANGERNLSGGAFSWDTDRGWYFDLPAGQQSNTDPTALFGAAVFTTNQVAMTNCSAASFFYVVDIITGLNVTPEAGAEGSNFASARIGDFTVSAITALGYDGRGSRDFGFTFQRSTTRVGDLGRSVDCPVGSSACRAEPSIGLPPMRRKNSWRQVQRQ